MSGLEPVPADAIGRLLAEARAHITATPGLVEAGLMPAGSPLPYLSDGCVARVLRGNNCDYVGDVIFRRAVKRDFACMDPPLPLSLILLMPSHARRTHRLPVPLPRTSRSSSSRLRWSGGPRLGHGSRARCAWGMGCPTTSGWSATTRQARRSSSLRLDRHTTERTRKWR